VRPPVWPAAARAVRTMIRDGTLKPGDLLPSARALSARTGISAYACRKAVLIMARKGELVPPASRSGRPRVPGGNGPGQAELELSAALAGVRRSRGLTQEDLAGRSGLSLTTVVHAETGRLGSTGAHAWARLDRALGAGGRLARMHADWQASGSG